MRIARDYLTPSAAYMGVLCELHTAYQNSCVHQTSPRNQPTVELTHYAFSVQYPDSDPVVTLCPERNAKIAQYTTAEIALHQAGRDDAASFVAASSFWREIANDDGTIESAYGKILDYDQLAKEPTPRGRYVGTPLQWVVDRILKDRSTRQAVAVVLQPRHYRPATKDFPCTCHLQFRMDETNSLDVAAVMRSNDVVRGLPYDMAYFMAVQEYVATRLSQQLDESVLTGEYFHFAHSMHLYLRDVAKVRDMIGVVAP